MTPGAAAIGAHGTALDAAARPLYERRMMSPTDPIGAADHGAEARELERIPLDLPASFVVPGAGPRAGRVMNLSAKGVFLGTRETASIGSPVALTASLPVGEGPRTLRVAARVRWINGRSAFSTKVPPGMGLEFLDLDRAAERLVHRFIEEYWTARRAAARGGVMPDARLTRRHFLMDFPARVRRQDGTLSQGRVVNLSGIGVFLATTVTEAPGREVGLSLTLPYQGRRTSLDLTAVVRWVNDPAAPTATGLPPGMGLEFVSCPTTSRRLLEQVVGDLHMQADGTWGL